MTNKFQLLQRSSFQLKNPLESNPQLFREIKGKINGKNIFITSFLSMLLQLFVIASHFGELPGIGQKGSQYSQYCTGAQSTDNSEYLCIHNSGIWQINWELLWHDVFIFLSITSVFILLIICTYMIIADLVKEETAGTLNFIRLSPQSASNIFLGKILGVPALVYLFIASIFPLHSISAFKANIPWYLILLFDLVIIASCASLYSISVLFSLLKLEKAESKPGTIAFVVAFFLLITTAIFFENPDINNSLIKYLFLFNPLIALTYFPDLMAVTNNSATNTNIESLGGLLFYGQPLWTKAITGMSFILLNYCLWTYWFWQGATRLFHNPTSTIFSKKQSYWITSWFVTITLGFTLQNIQDSNIFTNFMMLQCLLLLLFLSLVTALSPHRQTLYDWARYRHQLSKNDKSLIQELVFGEKSPSSVAIAINAGIATIIIAVGCLLCPFAEQKPDTVILTSILTTGIILLYSVIVQWMLLMKSNRRVLWTSIFTSMLILVPPILFAIADATPQNAPLVWLFSVVPVVGIEYASVSALILGVLGQWLAITFVSFQMMRKLRQAGRSETQKILAST